MYVIRRIEQMVVKSPREKISVNTNLTFRSKIREYTSETGSRNTTTSQRIVTAEMT